MTRLYFGKKILTFFIGIVALFLLSASESGAQNEALTTLSGRVIDKAGQPIAGLTVVLFLSKMVMARGSQLRWKDMIGQTIRWRSKGKPMRKDVSSLPMPLPVPCCWGYFPIISRRRRF